MPRTRVPKKTKKNDDFHDLLLSYTELFRDQKLAEAQTLLDNFISSMQEELHKASCNVPQYIAKMTIGELKSLAKHWSGNSTSSSVQSILEVTKTVKQNKTITRSSSLDNDDGYHTSSTSKGSSVSSSNRQSRAKTRKIRTSKRLSRSVETHTNNRYKTPAGRLPPNSFGTVTPKVKPNTPQALLRHARAGEFVMSLNGSPIVTGTVTQNLANINIPLDDGNIITIQPHRGMKFTDIPDLDEATKVHLNILRDNLNKFCAFK